MVYILTIGNQWHGDCTLYGTENKIPGVFSWGNEFHFISNTLNE